MLKQLHWTLLLLALLAFNKNIKAQIIFSEDWSSGGFTTGGWTFPSGQANWLVGSPTFYYAPTGATAPYAYFNWSPTLNSYSHELVSPIINATSYSGGSVFLSYKLNLFNYGNGTLEQFAVEYKTVGSPSWFTLTNYDNASLAGGANQSWTPTNVILPGMAGQNFQIRFRAYGAYSWWIWDWAVDDIQVLALNPCSGTPNAGTATAVPNNPCPGLPVTLNLTGATIAGGLAYQWQVSYASPSGPWTNIGTTNPYQTYPPPSSTSWYRCVVTCTSNGLNDTSNVSNAVVVQPFSPTSPCYCNPISSISGYCINNVTFGTLNNTTGGCTGVGNYNMYTTPVANFVQGNTYTFNTTTTPGNNSITSVWIDFNHSTTFGADTVEWHQVYTTGSTGSVSIPIPPSSTPGQTRMRVRSTSAGSANGAPNSCTPFTYGETEDYIINITPAGPYDINIGSMAAPTGNLCPDSSQSLCVQVYNYGSTNINTLLHPVTVTFTVNGPTGIQTYTATTPTSGGTIIPAFGASALTYCVSPVNLYTGGVYNINALVSCPTISNASLSNDSLANPIIITNYRPQAIPNSICQYGGFAFGQGIGVSGCSAPLYDSVDIVFNLTTCIDNVGAAATGTTAGPGNANCNNLYAGNFGNATLPSIPLGANFYKPGLLTVDHLNTGFASEMRFILYSGPGLPLPSTTWAPATLGFPGPTGDTTLVGVCNPVTGSSTNAKNYRYITPTQLGNMFGPLNTTGAVNLGYWESFNDLVAASDITPNSGGPTVAKLRVYYSYVPPAFAWFDVPSGGSSLYSLTPFDPLSVPNAVVNNSNVPGDYTFYAACLGLTNCRVPVSMTVHPTPTAIQDSMLSCEYALSANNAIFDLTSLNSSVSGGLWPSASVLYYNDQNTLSIIPNPMNDTSSTNVVYSEVFYTYGSLKCATSDSVILQVSTIPQFSLPVYSGFACAPNAIDISSLINIFPSTGNDTLFYDDIGLTQPYSGNPHTITTADTLYLVVQTNDGAGCRDTSTAYIDVLPATNQIVNQDAGGFSICGSVGCGNINLSEGNTETLYTTADCRRIATVTDFVDGINLGSTAICEDIDCSVQFHNGQPYVNRHYEITPTNNGKAIVCLYYLEQDFLDFDAAAFPAWPTLDSTTVCITQVDNGDITTPGHTAISIPNSAISKSFDASIGVWTLCFPVDSFSYFYCSTCNPNNTPLPVTLTSFTGKRLGSISALSWETSNEQNNHHFIVERSKDAKNFTPISSAILSKAVGGNSSTPLNYTYNDEIPMNGHNYYRLQQVDIDGHVSNSGTVDVYFGNETLVTMYPNPVNSELNIEINSPKSTTAHVKIMDATGRVVKHIEMELQAGQNVNKVDVQHLADGVYMVNITNNKGLNYSQTIRKK